MDKYFGTTLGPLAAIFISAVGIYLAVILFTRLAGKRSFSKMSSFDFAITVAIGSIIASTILLPSVSLLQGICGLASVYILQLTASYLRRFQAFGRVIDNTPLLLMDGSNILQDNLKKAKVTEGDLRSKLREANVLNFSQIKAVVLETTGDISVLHAEDDTDVADWILKDVKR